MIKETELYMEQINEEWRPVVEYEGLYQVSNLGRVRSLGKGIILRPVMKKNGYFQVDLHKEGKGKWFLVHRLVAQAFIPNSEGLPQINHRDEDKTNNLVDNLEYCDCKYNSNYGTRNERQVQTNISNGRYDPELCGLTEKERKRMYYQKNLEKMREQSRERTRKWREKNRDRINERQREYRQKKKQSSEESLW